MFLKKTMEQLERFSGMIDIIPEKAILEKKLNEIVKTNEFCLVAQIPYKK